MAYPGWTPWRGSTSPAQNSQPSANDERETFWAKFLAVPILVLTTTVSSLILFGLENQWMIHGNLYDKVDNARATTTVIVQILAGLLGAFQVQVVCQLLNFASRIALTQRPMSLDRLKVWNALSLPSMDLSTPAKSWPVIITYFLATLGPAALWAGALTPTPTLYTATASVNLPRYSDSSYSFWSKNIFSDDSPSIVNSQGTFSYQPTQSRFGYLVTDGSTASSIDGALTQHQKNDNSNYTFLGRSYGVASSVGLTDDNTKDGNRTTSYNYTETGYYPSVECIYNSTADFSLILIQPGTFNPLWEIPSLYLATGSGPNTIRPPGCKADILIDCGGWVTASLDGDKSIVAVAWWASTESGLEGLGLPRSANYVDKTRPPLSKAFTAIASGSMNLNLNRTQCSISMIPTSFSVDVDVLGRTIRVTPQNNGSQINSNITDIEPSGFIADSASSALAVMSVADTTFYSSVLGIMFQSNIGNLQLNFTTNENSTAAESDVYKESTLQRVAETVQVIIDDYLLAIASAQLIIAQDSTATSATVSTQAFSIGDRSYAIAVFALNALILLTFIVEALRTRFWQGLPKFNYKDVKSVVIASSLGSCDVGDTTTMNADWVAGSNHRAAGATRVILRPKRRMMLLSLLDNANLDEDSRPMLQPE